VEIYQNPMKKSEIKQNLLFISLFLIAFLERTVFDLGANVELLTTALILTCFFMGGKKAFWLTLAVIALSDRIIGNSKIFLFTWSGFLIPALFSEKIVGSIKSWIGKLTKRLSNTITLPLAGVSVNIFFYLWTNFGVWALDSWGMYTKDLSGLVRCYINGLPFLKNQIVSSLVFIPLGYLTIKTVILLDKKLKLDFLRKKSISSPQTKVN